MNRASGLLFRSSPVFSRHIPSQLLSRTRPRIIGQHQKAPFPSSQSKSYTSYGQPTRPYLGQPIIYGIIAANLGFFAWFQLSPPQQRMRLASNSFIHVNTIAAKPWTALTSAFSHIGLSHLAFNMINLYTFGMLLVGWRIKAVHLVTLTTGSALAGSLGELTRSAQKPVRERKFGLGASGMVMGLGAAASVVAPTLQLALFGIVPCPLFLLTAGYAVFDIMYLDDPNSNIGHGAHLGGAVFGALYALAFFRRGGGSSLHRDMIRRFK